MINRSPVKFTYDTFSPLFDDLCNVGGQSNSSTRNSGVHCFKGSKYVARPSARSALGIKQTSPILPP